jgi:phosphoribosylaminoimidazole-succinocarboxamide synthase
MSFILDWNKKIMHLIRKGKVKDIFQLENGNLLFHFSDRISAFDVPIASTVPHKGQVLCRFSEFWFKSIGLPHHMIRVTNETDMEVRPLKMIPLECVVRGYLYGSLYERQKKLAQKNGHNRVPLKASRLSGPVFDPTTKSEVHDTQITRNDAIVLGLVSEDEYDYLERSSIALYKVMNNIVESKGYIIADAKFEFGKDPTTGHIYLADSIGPDEFRLWRKDDYSPGKDQKSFDKQILRDWLIKKGFRTKLESSSKQGSMIETPLLPQEILSELSKSYVRAYEEITGMKLSND